VTEMIPDPPTVLFAVIRSGGTPPAKPWHVLGSAMFDTAQEARRFADLLDHASVYRLTREDE